MRILSARIRDIRIDTARQCVRAQVVLHLDTATGEQVASIPATAPLRVPGAPLKARLIAAAKLRLVAQAADLVPEAEVTRPAA